MSTLRLHFSSHALFHADAFIINILKRQAAMTDDPEDDLQWLRYWVVLATVHMIELVFVILTTNMFFWSVPVLSLTPGTCPSLRAHHHSFD